MAIHSQCTNRNRTSSIHISNQLSGEYLVALLGYLASGSCPYPKRCERKACRRLFDSDCPLLTIEASKAYVRFAINKDACFFGFRCDQRVHRATDVIIDGEFNNQCSLHHCNRSLSERLWGIRSVFAYGVRDCSSPGEVDDFRAVLAVPPTRPNHRLQGVSVQVHERLPHNRSL